VDVDFHLVKETLVDQLTENLYNNIITI